MTFKFRMGGGPDDWQFFPEALFAAMSGRGEGDWRKRWNQSCEDATAYSRAPRARKRRMFDNGELRLVLLKLIADEPRHGYDLIKAIEEMTEGGYAPSPGIIYPTLSFLEDGGLIAQKESEGSRKIFAITEDGRKELADKADEVDELTGRLDEAGDRRRARAERHGAPVGRAIGNLMAALGNRVARGDTDADTRHAIAEILDEAARKIERL